MEHTADDEDGIFPVSTHPLNSAARQRMIIRHLNRWALLEILGNYDLLELIDLSNEKKAALILRIRTHLCNATLRTAAQAATADLIGRQN